MAYTIDIAIGGFWLIAGAALQVCITWIRLHNKNGHLSRFIGNKQEVQIVLPSAPSLHESSQPLKRRKWRDHKRSPTSLMPRKDEPRALDLRALLESQPHNVLWGPTIEGAAVAELLGGFREAVKNVRVEFAHAGHFSTIKDREPFVSVGGPSVNAVSETLINDHLPDFEIKYPEHMVTIQGRKWGIPSQSNGSLTEDYGFILAGRTRMGTPFVVLWGVYAFGTLAAARAFIDLSNRKKFTDGEKESLASKGGMFLVVHANVDGYKVAPPIPIKPQPGIYVRP
ncbi:hypothetical protein [Streptomyces iranensis]|uniref:Secreted protein n=1 Tax=Streptomyces iranensis TaxID=576784 RepID=A0ABS4N561_9ACTN|nr:hypothetical protein [Streptomyces iranensis]MBP2067170.1 hypothetical protein [Streptomyces iranensis]